jgi:hypothetical protein
MKVIDSHSWQHPKIITFDIETILKNNEHIPYLYAMFDGTYTYSWFTEFPKSLFSQLLKPKYRGYQVYAHNLSTFDIIFIFKFISSLKEIYKITIMKKEEKIISIKIFNKKIKCKFDN